MRTNMRDQFTAAERAEWRPKIIARNTFRYTREDETVIRLHATDVARVLPSGAVVLNSGGYKTVTTKDRMNTVLKGYSLYQSKGLWYVRRYSDGKTVPYYDGIMVPKCFDVSGPAHRAAERNEKRETALRAKVLKFVKQLDKLECLPNPSQGDCWLCSLQDKDGHQWGEGDPSHILSHVRESYLHGSLILNALKWAGYNNPGFIWQLGNRDLKEGKTPWHAKNALRRYLYRQLGLAT